MKKTCNRCGHELELDKRSCSSCGAFNPFFIPGFNTSTVQSDVFEKQRIEEERQAMELAEKEKREQKLQKELEEAERRHQERLKEMIVEAPAKPEQVFIQTRKSENSDNLQPVQQTPNVENEPPVVPSDKNVAPGAPSLIVPGPAHKSPIAKRWVLITAMVILLSVGGSLTYFHFAKPEPAVEATNSSALHAEISPAPRPSADESVPATNLNTSSGKVPVARAIEPGQPAQNAKITATPVMYKKDIVPVTPAKLKRAGDFVLTVAKVKSDLVGRRLSGCGITIRKAAEILSLGNPVFIEQLPSGYMKYKLVARVVQGNEIYNSTPYVYYNTNGNFIKVDGTNCE